MRPHRQRLRAKIRMFSKDKVYHVKYKVQLMWMSLVLHIIGHKPKHWPHFEPDRGVETFLKSVGCIMKHFHNNPSTGVWDISVWTTVVDRFLWRGKTILYLTILVTLNCPKIEKDECFMREVLVTRLSSRQKDTKSFLLNILFIVQIHISRLGEIKGFFSFLNILLNKNITTIYNHS